MFKKWLLISHYAMVVIHIFFNTLRYRKVEVEMPIRHFLKDS